jgi:hypothetical protein
LSLETWCECLSVKGNLVRKLPSYGRMSCHHVSHRGSNSSSQVDK